MSGVLARLFSTPNLFGSVQRFTGIAGLQCSQLQLQLQMAREKSTKPKRRKTHPFHWWVPRKRKNMSEDHLTPANYTFLQETAAKNFLGPGESPLREEPWEKKEWSPGVHRTGVIARKIGIYPMWTKDGRRLLTTLLQVCDNHVISYIPPEEYALTRFGYKSRGFGALIVGAEAANPVLFTDRYLGLFKESGVGPKKKLAKFHVSADAAVQPGTPLFASHFRVGDYVNVYGKTVGHGFQGVVKRWGFKGGRATHGTTKNHRRPGAIGGSPRGRVDKNKKMPGHMGQERRLLAGLKIWRINHLHNVIFVHGPSVPGHVHAHVYIYDSYITKKSHTAENPPPFPTYSPDPEDPLADEVYDKDLQRFDDSSVVFAEEEQVKRKLKVKAKMKAGRK